MPVVTRSSSRPTPKITLRVSKPRRRSSPCEAGRTPKITLRVPKPGRRSSPGEGVSPKKPKIRLIVREPKKEPASESGQGKTPRLRLYLRRPDVGSSSSPPQGIEVQNEEDNTSWMQEMREAINLALGCTSCLNDATPEIMDADLQSGFYDPNRDMVFCMPSDVPDLDPMEPDHGQIKPGYFTSASEAQLVELRTAREEMKPVDCYAFFRHIHEHRLLRRGFVRNICYDKEDVKGLHTWSWHTATMDGVRSEEDMQGLGDSTWPRNDYRMKMDVNVWSGETERREEHQADNRREWLQKLREMRRERREILRTRPPPSPDDDWAKLPREKRIRLIKLRMENPWKRNLTCD